MLWKCLPSFCIWCFNNRMLFQKPNAYLSETRRLQDSPRLVQQPFHCLTVRMTISIVLSAREQYNLRTNRI